MSDATTENVYIFIQHYIEQNALSPTIREIADSCFLNVATVLRHLDRLEAQGRLIRTPYQARSIRLISNPK